MKLAIDHTVEKVEATVALPMSGSKKWDAADVLASLAPEEILVPSVAELDPELGSYDQLLSSSESAEEVTYVV